jgi:diketogulonate reductase-like aldo/keto reductase
VDEFNMEIVNINTTVKLNNGVEIPILGLGTWQINGKEAEKSILYALDAGYRHIDTATIYDNEEDVGRAIRKSSIPREDLFITTKVWNDDHGYKPTITACDRSLKRLGLSYVDMYLIHWPVKDLRNETWKAMEALLESGKCRAIGVSNFTTKHLEQLMEQSPIVPTINQVEFSPYLYQRDLLEFCRINGIQLEAYSPLTRGKRLKDSKLIPLAAKYSKSTAQILIRWALQLGIVTIPKASNEEHIRANADVFDFEISSEDMGILNSFNENSRICWDPAEAE